jgi:hypothetical protein
MIGSAIVLTLAIVFQGDPADMQTASIVSVLPLPPSPPYAENDPRVNAWFLAYLLATRIDDRGRMLARGGMPEDVAEELRFANLRDFETLAAALARLESWNGCRPWPRRSPRPC